MKVFILYLSVFLTCLSCTPKQKGSVFLFNDVSFNLIDGEEVATIDSKKKEMYYSHFDESDIQIPLFKCIQSDSYMLYIGIPFNTSIRELNNHNLTQTLNQTFFEGDSISYFYKTYFGENKNIVVYTKNFDNNLVYVLTVSNSAELSDFLFNIKALSNRFNK